jgi:tetratricopeptide (TPR) repeat protein
VGYFNVSLARERSAAVEAAAQAEETKDLLISFLSSPDPYSGTGANTRVIDLLANAEAVVSEQLAHRPELQIEVLASLADVYQNLSVIDRAIALRQQELEIRRALGPSQALPILSARRKLAVTNLQSGAVEPALEELNAVLAELSESHPGARLEIAQTRHAIGALLVTHGSGEAARPYLEAAIEAFRLDGSEPIMLAAALTSYALVFEDYSVRLEYEKEAFALREKYQGPEHPATLGTAAQIAATLTDLSRYEESLEIYQSLIPPVERAFGPLHTETLGVLNNLAVTLSFNGDIEAALERHQDILERRRQKYGDTHPLVAGSLQNVGASLNELGRLEESIPFLNEASRIYPEVNLPGSPVTAYPHISLAGVYSELDRIDELERHARRAIELLEGNVSEDNVALLKSRCLLGAALIQRGQAEVGIPMVRHAIDGMAGQTRISPRHIEQCRGILERAVPTEDGPQVQDQDPDLPQTS